MWVSLRNGAALVATAAEEDQVAVGLLDGRGGAWLIRGAAMPFHLRACLDQISERTGGIRPNWGLVLVFGIRSTIPAERAGELESLLVRAACEAIGGRYLLSFVSATLMENRIITHVLGEQEVSVILASAASPTQPQGTYAVWR